MAIVAVEPFPVGIPETVPVAALIVRPAGRLVADHVYGAVPPYPVKVNE